MRLHWFATVAAAEIALVLCVLGLAAWQFAGWVSSAAELDPGGSNTLAALLPPFGNFHLMVAVLLATGLYGLIQFFGKSSLALWALTILVILPQIPGVWSHNKLSWEKFMGVEASMGEGHPFLLAGAIFVGTLLGLVVLHRVIALRKLGGLLSSRNVDTAERDGTLANEGLALAVIVSLALVLALVLVGAGTVMGGSTLLTSRVPWAVVTVGGGASLLLLGFIALFLRGLSAETTQREPGSGG